MGIVSLEGMEFFARHGFYEAERQLGNRYSVDVSVETDFTAAVRGDELSGTVNYEELYRIVQAEMETPSKLLEHLAGRIAHRIRLAFPGIKATEVSISKYNPPVGGVCYRSRICLRNHY